MSSLQIIFYVLAAMVIFSGVMVVSSRNSVHGALFLVLAFFSMAGIWMLLQAEFLALILVLVYVGAVMTLFLFVVMMLQVNVTRFREGFVRYLPLGLLMVLMIIGLLIYVVRSNSFHMTLLTVLSSDYDNTANLGMVLYTDYAYPFEIAAVLLLTAIVAAISLTHRKSTNRKTQIIENQIAVNRKDRVRLVKMPFERKK
jgi:NADH-quinone oxidoreductase subunit J